MVLQPSPIDGWQLCRGAHSGRRMVGVSIITIRAAAAPAWP
jgi:hypothetical protein